MSHSIKSSLWCVALKPSKFIKFGIVKLMYEYAPPLICFVSMLLTTISVLSISILSLPELF